MYTTSEILSMPVEKLEEVLHQSNVQAYAEGDENFLTDSDFGRGIERLQAEKPDSPVLEEVNGLDIEDEFGADNQRDGLFEQTPMRSVESVSSEEKMGKFNAYANRVNEDDEQMGSLKADGYSIRAGYSLVIGEMEKYMEFKYGMTRGRNTIGTDISRHLKLILPTHLDLFTEFSHVEIRGELVLPIENHKILRERHPEEVAKGNLVNARNSVAFLLKEGTSDEDIKLLKLVVFNVVVPKNELDRLKDTAKWALKRSTKIAKAKEAGFFTIPYCTFKFSDRHQYGLSVTEYAMALIENFAKNVKEQCGYKSDGVVFNVDNEERFIELGHSKKYNYGAVGMKVGAWKASDYTAKIKRVYRSYGSKNISLMAEIYPVTTDNGNTITSLELKTSLIMQSVKAYPGNTVRFQYSSDMIPDLLYPGHGLE